MDLIQATVSFFIFLPSSFRSGGGERDRTDDLLLAKQALSQLSYTPDKKLVGLDGFEPSTPALSRRCSNQLSYRPRIQDLGSRIEGGDFSPLDPRSTLLESRFYKQPIGCGR